MTDSVTDDEALAEEEALQGGADDEGEPEAPESDGDDASGAADDGDTAQQRAYDALNDRHLRLVAEFNNFRRRSEQERLSAWARAQADVIAKFVDVLDDLNRVAQLDLTNATVEAIIEGVDLVERKFVRMLQDSGVEIIDPAGQPFDPERMEAMMRVPAESEEQDDVVAQVFDKGYALKGVLVRPARVAVYKNA
jgi:molecular chaperone GrpE